MRTTLAAVVLAVFALAAISAQTTSPQRPPAPKVDAPEAVRLNPRHEMTTDAVPGLTAATSACGISDDEAYAVSADHAVSVGGGMLYMAAREIKYLMSLRGPNGEGLHFFREGSAPRSDRTIVDIYSVTYEGLAAPRTIYIDGYHWDTPLAPKGWLCGADMNLVPPGPDSFETWRNIRTMAIEMGSKEVEPISIDPDGSKTHGVFFDYVRLVALSARTETAQGRTFDAGALPASLGILRSVVVAFPMDCHGKSIAPDGLAVRSRNGQPPQGEVRLRAVDWATLTPGYTPPEGAIGVTYTTPELLGGQLAVVQYHEPCDGGNAQVVLPLNAVQGRVLSGDPAPAAGPQPDPDQVRVQVLVAQDGTPRFPVFAAGNWPLRDAAIAAVATWRFAPPTINGAYIIDTFVVAVRVH